MPAILVGDEVGVRRPRRMLRALDDHEKLDHAPDPVLRFHQLEATVHLVERDAMRDERVGVDLAGEPALDERRDAVASLHAAERRAGDPPAGDQVARHDVERLAFAGDARDRAQAPAHARRFDRLPHHGDVTRRLEGVVGAEAAGRLDDPLDRVGAAEHRLRRAVTASRARADPRRGRRRRCAPRPAGGSRSLRRARPCPRRRRRMSSPASTFAVLIAAPIPVESPHAKSAAPSSGASGLIFASAISGITVYSANVEVPMK